MKELFLIILSFLIHTSIFGQQELNTRTVDCETIAKKILSDSSISLWDYPNKKVEDYYCLGQYFANWDIDQGNYHIQTYGSPEYHNDCIVCNYSSLNISFRYHFDIILDHVSEFIEGYNQVSESFLKDMYGENIFDSLDAIDSNKLSPIRAFEVFQKDIKLNYLDISIINDTVINVKMKLDSIGQKLGIDLSNLLIDIFDVDNRDKASTITFAEFTENGIILNEFRNDRYFLIFKFNFSAIEQFCFCENLKGNIYKYTLPITVKNI